MDQYNPNNDGGRARRPRSTDEGSRQHAQRRAAATGDAQADRLRRERGRADVGRAAADAQGRRAYGAVNPAAGHAPHRATVQRGANGRGAQTRPSASGRGYHTRATGSGSAARPRAAASAPRGGQPSARSGSTGRTFHVQHRRRRRRWPALVAAVAVVVCAMFGVRAVIAGQSQDAGDDQTPSAGFVDYEADATAALDEVAGVDEDGETQAYASTADAIRAVVPTVGELSIAPFSLTGSTLPAFDTSQRQSISRAVDQVEASGSCSFVFLDLESGLGLASNADAVVYSASSIKAPFVYYILQRADAESTELSDDVRQSIESTIVNSDNDAYTHLHDLYEDDDYHAWARSRGIDDEEGSNYALVSARSMAAVWSEIEEYCDGGSELGTWFKQLLGETTSSFIRNGLDGTSDAQAGAAGGQGAGSPGQQIGNILSTVTGSGAAGSQSGTGSSGSAQSSSAAQAEVGEGGWTTDEYRANNGGVDLSDAAVYDKAGWISDDFWGNAVNDCAFIELDGRVYLLAIITSQPDDGSAEQAVANLAYALMSSREALAA